MNEIFNTEEVMGEVRNYAQGEFYRGIALGVALSGMVLTVAVLVVHLFFLP